MSDITDGQYALMIHAVGLDCGKPYIRHGRKFYKPSRNYFYAKRGTRDDILLRCLEDAGFVVSKFCNSNSDMTLYALNSRGMDALGKHIGVKIRNDMAKPWDLKKEGL